MLFISKSLGSVVAGWIDDKLGLNARHIYLTPVRGTLPYIRGGGNISMVIAGTKDHVLDTAALQEHCSRENVRLELVEGAGHSLQIVGDVIDNIDILRHIVALY